MQVESTKAHPYVVAHFEVSKFAQYSLYGLVGAGVSPHVPFVVELAAKVHVHPPV